MTESLGRLGRDTVAYAVGNTGMRVVGFLLIPVYTRVLDVEQYGLLNALLTLMYVLLHLAMAGLGEALLRFHDEFERRGLVGRLVGTSVLLMTAIIAALTAAALLLADTFESLLHVPDGRPYLVAICSLAGSQAMCLYLLTVFRAEGAARKYTAGSLGVALLLALGSLVVLLGLRGGVEELLWAHACAYAAVLAVVGASVFRRVGFGVSAGDAARVLRFGVPLIPASLGYFAMEMSGILLVSYFGGLFAVAVFSLGQKLASALQIVLALPFRLAFSPFVFRSLGTADAAARTGRSLTYLALAVAAGTVALCFLGRLLLPFVAPPEYAEAYLYLVLMMPIVALNTFAYVGETLLQVGHRTVTAGAIVGGGGAAAVGLGFVLTPALGPLGAIAAGTAAYAAVAALLLRLGLRTFPARVEGARLGALALAYVLVLLLFVASRSAPTGAFLTVVPLVLAALVVLGYRSPLLDGDERRAIREAGLRVRQGWSQWAF